MKRGTGRGPYLKDDKYTSSEFYDKRETKTNPERRLPVQHPYNRQTTIGFAPVSTAAVFFPFVQNPFLLYPNVQQAMTGFSRAGRSTGANLNQWSDPRVIGSIQNRFSSATSQHHHLFQNSSGIRKAHIEQGRVHKNSSCEENLDDKKIADCPATSQTEGRGNELNLSRQPHSSRQVRGEGRTSIVQQRNLGKERSNSHYMQHFKERGQLQVEFRKDKLKHIYKTSGKETACGSEGPIERQGDSCWRNQRAANESEMYNSKHESGQFTSRNFQREMGSVESNYGISHGEPGLDKRSASQRRACGFGRGAAVMQESQSRMQQGEAISVEHSYGISHEEPKLDRRSASQRKPAGFGRETSVMQESQFKMQDYPAGETRTVDSVEQNTYAYKSCEKTEKTDVETKFSENPCSTTGKKVMSANADSSFTPADDISSHTEPGVVVSTEPCFQSQLELGRRWSYFQKVNHRDEFAFTVVSYNVLEDQLLKNNCDLYAGYPGWLLDWEYRKKNLLKEILDFRADILCLQEVQEEHYHEWFHPNLRIAGYYGIFKKRTGDKPDGCAIFFKVNKFNLVQSKEIEFRRSEIAVLDRDNIALVALLQPKNQLRVSSQGQALKEEWIGDLLCVANTHLLFNTNRGDIKLLQLAILFAELDQLTYEQSSRQHVQDQGMANKGKTFADIPVILCGDLNSQPFSPLYGFVTSGIIRYAGMSRTAISGQNKPRFSYRNTWILQPNLIPKELKMSDSCQWVRHEVDPVSDEQTEDNSNPNWTTVARSSSSLRHAFNLSSVYRHYFPDRQPEVTTFHNMVCCTVDYIFYSQSRNLLSTTLGGNGKAQLELVGMLNLLGRDQLANSRGLPNEFVSSDHFALAAYFVLKR